MPKIPVIRPKDLIRLLQGLGFEIDHSTGSHYIMYHKEKRLRVVIPYHHKDIPKGTLLSIIHSAGLSKDDFVGLL